MLKLYAVEDTTSFFFDEENNIKYQINLEPVTNYENIIIQDNILSNDKYNRYNIMVTTKGYMDTVHLRDEKFEARKPKKIEIETPDLYETFKTSINSIDNVWIDNIINKKSETDKIIFENESFIILPDFKWNGTIDNLYLLLIAKDQTLKSIRDLRAHHIPLLTDMIDKTKCLLKDKYDLDITNVRMYFHYRPSVWQLHLHINNINCTKIFTCSVERAHSIINVINNLRSDDSYYNKAILEIVK